MSNYANPVFRCSATGDAMITRRLPAGGEYPGFREVRDFIMRADFRFGNLETTVHDFESCAGARSGGSWLCSPPGVLEDLHKFGINILSTANNHALDYSYGGLERTLYYIRESGLPFSGTGENLAAASRPAYIDTPSGRYALIGCTMSFNPENMAGPQTASLPGRPGVNGIRVTKKYRLPRKDILQIKRIADALGINAASEIIRAEGYLPQLAKTEQPFGELLFEEGEKAEIVPTVHPEDMKRIADAVAEARFMADYVVVAMHTHELWGKSKETVDPVSRDFSHACIDAGADAVIGTGPHLLRPMEFYKEKPVFYCLGDFIIQLETVLRAPGDMFAKQKLDGNARLDVLFNTRSDNGKRGLCYDPVMYEAVVPYWETKKGKVTQMSFLPVEEYFALPRARGGWPRPKSDGNILERFAAMCRPFDVDIRIEDGLGKVRF